MKPTAPPLPIHHRRTLEGRDGEQVTPLVKCPQHGGVVDLERCSACGNARGLALDSGTNRLNMDCDAVGDHSQVPRIPPPVFADAMRASVAGIMQRDVVCFSEDVPVSRATGILVRGGFSGAPVVDGEGRPIGVISLTDLVRQQHLLDNQSPPPSNRSAASVGQWMTPIVCSVPETAEIARAAAVMSFEGIHRVPVVSSERQVVGIVSALDIMRALAHATGFLIPEEQAAKQPKAEERRR